MRARRAGAIAAALLIGLGGLSGCTDRFDDGEQRLIAGGGVTGIYYAYGQQLAELLSAELTADFAVTETDGSIDNLLRTGTGQALVGFAQSDAAADAVAGTGAFSSPLPILAVARLYDEYVHVVVRADSDIARISDFEGRAVSLGAKNSGVTVVATRVLDASGVSVASLDNRELGLASSIEALRSGQIEGFFWVGGLPTPGIVQLADALPIRLLSIDSETVARINAVHTGIYRLAEFPVGAYGREGPTSTMTVPNFLVASEEVPDEVVYDILTVLFDKRLEIARQVPAAALLDRRQAIFTDPLELHPGAIRYYTETRR